MLYAADLFLTLQIGHASRSKGFIKRIGRVQQQASLYATGALRMAPMYSLDTHADVVHSYVDCWEVVVNRPAYIENLLLSGYFGRTFDSVGPLFTEVQIASCKAMHLEPNETQNVWFSQCLFLRRM